MSQTQTVGIGSLVDLKLLTGPNAGRICKVKIGQEGEFSHQEEGIDVKSPECEFALQLIGKGIGEVAVITGSQGAPFEFYNYEIRAIN